MLNKFALVVLILQLARAERHAAAQSCATYKVSNEADGTCKKQSDSTCSSTLDKAGCQTCTGSDDAQTCTACKVSTQFISVNKKGCKAACDATGEIAVPNADPKACKCNDGEGYTQQADGTCKKQSDNTNKSSLSTGAIAGISVAVIVVVGGLVGFLCWWFVCRGKA